jgi:uncharacterized protein (DUF58 family)
LKLVAFVYRLYYWIAQTRPIRFTRFGAFYILFAIGVGAAAINTGNNLLYLILGILLGFIVISGFLSDSGLWGIRTEWQPIGSLYAGEKAALECRIRKGWFPGVGVTVVAQWQGLPSLSTFVPWIPAKGSVSQRVTLTPQRRGYLALESCRYSTRFPFGLFEKSHTWPVEEKWVVYPRLARLPWQEVERLGKEFSRDASSRLGQGSVPFVLRDYRTGDALRQVHWKASAKRQRLVVKEMEEEANEGDLFYLSAWPVDLDPAMMERFISFVASLVFTAYERGRPVGLELPERRFKPEFSRVQLHRIFEFLALVDPYKKVPPSAESRPLQWNGVITDIGALWTLWGSRHVR